MKLRNLLKTASWLLLAIATLIWYRCHPPDLGVVQPNVAEKHSSFEARVWVTGHRGVNNREASEITSKIGLELPLEWQELERSGNVRQENWLYFGIKIPQGWEVTDPIPYHGVAEGHFVHSDSLTAAMASLEPPEPGYCWWVSETVEPITTSTGTIEFYPEILTDGQSGNFFIDYMLGFNGSLNRNRNNDHNICIGLADTTWVTSLAENGTGSIRAAIDSVCPGGHVFFDVDGLFAPIMLSGQIEIYKSVHIHGPMDKNIIISGNDCCRIFYLPSGKELHVDNLQIVHGNADNGGAVYCSKGSMVHFDHVKIRDSHANSGGAIYCEDDVSVIFKDSEIRDNNAQSGGGIYFRNAEITMENTTICKNTATDHGGGIYFASAEHIHFDPLNRCDIYQNSAYLGYDLYNAGEAVIDVVVDTFTVAWPNPYFAFHSFNIDLIHHILDQYQQDLYVSPEGSDENPGVTPDQPKKTITNALAMIAGTEFNPNTIHLAPGIYSPAATGEKFPLYCHSHVSIKGSTEDSTILSGEDRYRIFEIIDSEWLDIGHMIIQNASGSGIYCQNSSPSLSDLVVRNCMYQPALIFNDCQDVDLSAVTCYNNGYSSYGYNVISLNNSSATMTHSDIFNNRKGISLSQSEVVMDWCSIHENTDGGLGLWQQSVANLKGCKVWGNVADAGGGIRCYEDSHVDLSGCLLKGNQATQMGGGIYLESSTVSFSSDLHSNIYLNEAPLGKDMYNASLQTVDVVADTFTVLYPSCYFTVPISGFTFDILHGKLPQYDQDLFVSPSGSDENTGLTPDDPLLSITKAMMTICTPGGAHTIHLAPGTYAPTSTGELFPLQCQDSVSIRGEPDSVTILSGENNKRVIHAHGTHGVVLSNLRITFGMSDYGGGIYAKDADLTMENILLEYNTATVGGGGMYVEGNTRITTENVTISHNTARRGGGLYLESTNLMLSNLVLSHNQNNSGSSSSGGGVFCNLSDAVFHDLYLESNESYRGGGMACYGCDPSFENVVFQGNLSNYCGGGLSLQSSSPTLSNVTFSDNKSNQYGGGIFLTENSDALLLDVEFDTNRAPDGGGLYGEGSRPLMMHCTFVGNHASENGAGMYLEQCDPVLSDVLITGNVAENNGGGLYLSNHSMPSVFGTVIYANEAQNGGGVFNTDHSNPYFSGSFITNNAGFYGGGLYCTDEATLTFDPDDRCNIYFNRAHFEGADLYNNGYQSIPVVVDTFTVLYPTDFYAHQTENFDFDIWNFKVQQGEYDIYVSPEGSDTNTGQTPDDPLLSITAAFTRCMTDTVPPYKIHLALGTYSPSTTGECYPLYGRSDIWLLGTDLASTILDGDSSQILRIIGREGIRISDVTLRNGIVNGISDGGGGIHCEDASISLERTCITQCYADRGGGIYLSGNNSVTMQNVHIVNNLARYGAGMFCEGYATITGNNIKISNNQVMWPGIGGGIYARNFLGLLSNFSITDNEARKGGGIYFYRSSPYIFNMVISGNVAERGGAFYISRADSLRIMNTTVSENTASYAGAIYTLYDPYIELINCIFWANQEYPFHLDDGGLTFRHSDSDGGLDGIVITGNAWVDWQESINEDPLFCTTGNHPCSLTEGSPCIDSGTPDTTGLYLPPWDLTGNPRIWDGDGDGLAVIDMGAYEYKGTFVGYGALQVAGCRSSRIRLLGYPISAIKSAVSSRQSAVMCD